MEAGRFLCFPVFGILRGLSSVAGRHAAALTAGVEGVEVLLVEAVGGNAEGFAVAYRV